MYQPKNFSDIAEPLSELSHRKQQAIALVCEGLSNKEIAAKLGVTEGTVKAHLNSIYEQLGVLKPSMSYSRRGLRLKHENHRKSV